LKDDEVEDFEEVTANEDPIHVYVDDFYSCIGLSANKSGFHFFVVHHYKTAFHHCTFSFITAHFMHHCTLKQARVEGGEIGREVGEE